VGRVHSQPPKVLVRRNADARLELAGELADRQARDGGHVGQRHRLGQPLMQQFPDTGQLPIGQTGTPPVTGPGRRRTRHRTGA